MTYLRVTVGSDAYNSMKSINDASSELAKLQAQLSSGKRIQNISDDPMGTAAALSLQSGISRNDQYTANANDAQAWLSSADTTYSQMVDAMQSARTDVVKGLNTGASDSTSANALADAIDGIRSTMLSLANTQYNGRPLFGGTTASGQAYDSSGNYVGDSGSVVRQIGANNQVTVSAQGPAVFGAAGSDVFTLLSNISSQLRTDPSSLSSGTLSQVDTAISRLSTAQATEGAAYQQVQSAQTQQTAQGTAMTDQLSSITEVDMADMAVKVTTANTAYQAALQTTASVRQMSLLDFLK
jgi:flagellar hook-associated protein 3 FlgL